MSFAQDRGKGCSLAGRMHCVATRDSAFDELEMIAEMASLPIDEGLSRLLRRCWSDDFAITDLRKLVGGAARTTWRCTARHAEGERGLVFRIAAAGDGALHLSDEATEFAVVGAAFAAGIPVAEPLLFVAESPELGGEVAVYAEVADCELMVHRFSQDQRAVLTRDVWTALGRIAALDIGKTALVDTLGLDTPQNCALRQLAGWADIVQAFAVHPDPVAEAAIRWMRMHPPAPAQKLALVHGDYRVGNLLFAKEGRLAAVLDWEMAHIGDPLEDLAWSLDPRQEVDSTTLAGGLAVHAEAVAAWRTASGLEIDAPSLRWWQVFAAVKALAIWTKSGGLYARGEPRRPALARMGWVLAERQQRVLADYLSPHSAHRLYEYRP